MKRLPLLFIPLALAACLASSTGCTAPSSPVAPTPSGTSAGSSAPASPAPAEPAADLSTPDRALKSYWAYQDYLREAAADDERREEDYYLTRPGRKRDAKLIEFMAPPMSTVEMPDGDAEARKKMRDEEKKLKAPRFYHEILNVNKESESRAIVLVKVTNVVPVPDSVSLTPADLSKRSDGIPVKYVMTKTSRGWKIENLQVFDDDLDHPGNLNKVWTDKFKPKTQNGGNSTEYTDVYTWDVY